MKKTFASLLVASHLVTPRRRVDWTFLLSWAGIVIALGILLTVR
jgi:hypothetical protein